MPAEPPRPRPPTGGQAAGLAVLVLVLAAALAHRSHLQATPPGEGLLVEVAGAVERPGVHRLVEPTVGAALAAAGGPGAGALAGQPLVGGQRVEVRPAGIAVTQAVDPLLLGRRLDLNRADARSLQVLPGVGPVLARRIVAGRPYDSVDDLARVRGIGPATLERLRGQVRCDRSAP